jgi:peptidoglycan/LPS O-acetylase OafA/YrhL
VLDLFLRWRDLDLPNSFPEPYPFLVMTGFMLAASIALAAASYYAVERPALARKHLPVRAWFRRTRREAVV